MDKDETIQLLTQQIEVLTQTIAEQTKLISELQQQIAELTERIGKNSKNSSKPPSSDGYSKPSPKNMRQKSSKKQGGQDGHPGSNLPKRTDPTQIVQHMPKGCMGCPPL